ncbi:MAG: bifunctional pyr operon transcriptional regulator/uracil phosphoribosyltransferase PyrR [Flavobacteriales bacterium]|nr:bifunctional pyr operon transcriptional regulator/uracil phosphoribosyltransferase PyrR [Flavobacteriales bacterium]
MQKNRRTILNNKQVALTIDRLCQQLIENHGDFKESVIIGLQPRGVYLAEKVHEQLQRILNTKIEFGYLDVTFYRDDFRRRKNPISAGTTEIDFVIEDKRVVLIDDVLFTGRTIRSGLDALMAFGRPSAVELLVLIDRRFKRQLPIEPMYVGKHVDSIRMEKVEVAWKGLEKETKVVLFTPESDE